MSEEHIRKIITDGMPVYEDGKLVRYVGTMLDMTERHAAMRALQRSELLLNEAQRVAHLVIGDPLLLVGRQHPVLLLQARDDALDRLLQLGDADLVLVLPHALNRGHNVWIGAATTDVPAHALLHVCIRRPARFLQ